MAGGVGYYVWHTNSQAKASLDAASKSAASTPPKVTKKATGLTAGWKTYVSNEGKFTVRYPAGWVQPTNQDLCGDYLKSNLEVGPDLRSVIKCASDGTDSQVSIRWQKGDTRSDPANTLNKSIYTLNSQGNEIVADNVKGVVIAGEAKNQGVEPGLGALPDGTEIVLYIFYVHGNTYVARYTQYPSSQQEGPNQDKLADFNLMVTQTLKFE